jgi:hypothetical protein
MMKWKRLIQMHTIFARLEDHIIEVVSHNDLNRLVVDLRNRLRLLERRQLAILRIKRINEL